MSQHYEELSPGQPDPIVRASQEWPAFAATHEDPVNLTIGVNVSPETGRPDRPDFVQEAFQAALDEINRERDFGYQNPAGDGGFLDEFAAFVLGTEYFAEHRDEILRYQTLGGTGALWMAQELLSGLLRRDETGRVPMLLEPGYANHGAIFPDDEFSVSTYQHVDPATNAYNHQAALEAIAAMPPYSVALFQICGHNDTGADRTKAQWNEIFDAAQSRNLVLILDGAYIGLARGRDEDVYPVTEAARRGLLTFVCKSCSKIFGDYGERLGALDILNARTHLGDDQFNKLDTTYRARVRQTITGVPNLVARAGAIVFRDPRFLPWLEQTRQRIRSNRLAFCRAAGSVAAGAALGYGLFARLKQAGFTQREIVALNEHGLHVLPSSRVNFGGMRDEVEARRIGTIFAAVLNGS